MTGMTALISNRRKLLGGHISNLHSLDMQHIAVPKCLPLIAHSTYAQQT